jgi:hypothetical protein
MGVEATMISGYDAQEYLLTCYDRSARALEKISFWERLAKLQAITLA